MSDVDIGTGEIAVSRSVTTGPPVDLTDDGGLVVAIAASEEDRRRIMLEIAGRAWARAGGIAVPDIVGQHPDGWWLASKRADSSDRAGTEFVDLVLDVVDDIGRLSPPTGAEAHSTWRASRRSLPIRVARLARWGVAPTTFLRTRAAAAKVPHEVACHGDLHDWNIFYDKVARAVQVIDWEHATIGPRYSDALRLATTLDDFADMTYAVEVIVAGAPRADLPNVAALLEWLALRHFADHAALPVAASGERRIVELRRRWRWARVRAADLGHRRERLS